jgi:hypothetical protein
MTEITFLSTIRTYSLYILEICSVVFILYRWSIGPDDVISEFLYKDALQRSILSFFVLVHLSVIFYDLFEHSDLLSTMAKCGILCSIAAWITLIAYNNHTGSAIHNIGVVAYVSTSIATILLISFLQQDFIVRMIILLFLSVGTIFAMEYLQLFFAHNPNTWLAQHRAFLIMMIGFSLIVHFPPIYPKAITIYDESHISSEDLRWKLYGSTVSNSDNVHSGLYQCAVATTSIVQTNSDPVSNG